MFATGIAFTALVACMAVYTFMCAKGKRRLWMMVVVLPVLYAIGWVALNEALSRPKPVQTEIVRLAMKTAEIISHRLIEGQGIYLWLSLPGITEPRYYVLPWNMDMARELDAMAKSEEGKRGMMMSLPFRRSWAKKKDRFYPIPQPMLPEKMGRELPRELRPQGQEM